MKSLLYLLFVSCFLHPAFGAPLSGNDLQKEIAVLQNQVQILEKKVRDLETKPAFECMANCGFFINNASTSLIFAPLRMQGNTIAQTVSALETACSAKRGILFGGIEYNSGLQRLVAVAQYNEVDLNSWICSKL